MKAKLSHAVAAMMLLGPIAATVPMAASAQAAARSPGVYGMQLRADTGLARGSQLFFTVQATPHSRADIRINDTGIVVPLQQTSPGVYTGIYTVQPGDRIDANGLLRVGIVSGPLSNTVNYTFPESFIAWQNNNSRPPPLQQGALPEIERFTARSDGVLEPGALVRFTLHGAPGGDASLTIPGVARNIAMDEIRPGVYRGSYTVRRQDNPDGFFIASALLRLGDRSAAARLTEPLVAGGDRDRSTGTLGGPPYPYR